MVGDALAMQRYAALERLARAAIEGLREALEELGRITELVWEAFMDFMRQVIAATFHPFLGQSKFHPFLGT